MTVGSRTDEPRDTLASKFDFTNMRITGLGTFNYRATLTPPIYRIHPGGDGVVIADWGARTGRNSSPSGTSTRHGRLTRESAIGAELRPIPLPGEEGVHRGRSQDGGRPVRIRSPTR